ncbi:MAG: hypothetical protein ACRYFB_08450 [Janthinobacterium lividum]
MKIKYVIILLFLGVLNSNAQSLSNVNGTVVQSVDYSDIKGSQYLYEEWTKGDITMYDNTIYKNMDVKYSLLDDKLYFKGKDGQQVMSFSNPVKEFTVNDPSSAIKPITFREGYKNIPGITMNSFLEILVSGKTQLLKKVSKRIQTENVYPNTSVNKYFTESKQYYLYILDRGTLIKNDKKTILSILSDKKVPLENYIKENNLNLKEDNDLEKLITYYNSISI